MPLVPPSDVITSPRRNTLSAGPAAIVIALCPGNAEIPGEDAGRGEDRHRLRDRDDVVRRRVEHDHFAARQRLDERRRKLRHGALRAQRLLPSLPVDPTNVRCATV